MEEEETLIEVETTIAVMDGTVHKMVEITITVEEEEGSRIVEDEEDTPNKLTQTPRASNNLPRTPTTLPYQSLPLLKPSI